MEPQGGKAAAQQENSWSSFEHSTSSDSDNEDTKPTIPQDHLPSPPAPSSLWGNVSAPGIFCDPRPTGGPLPLICWATLYGFAPWPPGHQQMF